MIYSSISPVPAPDACGAGCDHPEGPAADRLGHGVGEAEEDVRETRRVKKTLTEERRREFTSTYRQMQLALIDRDGYVCSELGCDFQFDLTIDHVVPLSKGGSDDLDNLKFLCRRHNSEKGDR